MVEVVRWVKDFLVGGNFRSVGFEHGAYRAKFALRSVEICTRHSHTREKIVMRA